MADLEALVKQRIIAQKWDDAVRVVAAPISKTRKDVELDETKSKKVSSHVAQGWKQVFVRQ